MIGPAGFFGDGGPNSAASWCFAIMQLMAWGITFRDFSNRSINCKFVDTVPSRSNWLPNPELQGNDRNTRSTPGPSSNPATGNDNNSPEIPMLPIAAKQLPNLPSTAYRGTGSVAQSSSTDQSVIRVAKFAGPLHSNVVAQSSRFERPQGADSFHVPSTHPLSLDASALAFSSMATETNSSSYFPDMPSMKLKGKQREDDNNAESGPSHTEVTEPPSSAYK